MQRLHPTNDALTISILSECSNHGKGKLVTKTNEIYLLNIKPKMLQTL